MSLYSDVLLTVDFDRTLTGPDSTIPQRNLDAIHYFMDNGGVFTVNTGRSVNTFRPYLNTIPVNAPFLLYNGSASYENGALQDFRTIDLDMWQTMQEMARLFPDMNLEIQGLETHFFVNVRPEYAAFYDALGWDHRQAAFGQDLGPFLKFSLFGITRHNAVGDMFTGSETELRRFDEAQAKILSLYRGKVEVYRAAPRIIDVHAKGVSKIRAARDLQAKLGRKYLVCVGDAENDITMLDGADFAYCPADGVVADRYNTVCPCAEGAVADVILKKIPEFLGFSLDTER